MPSLKSKYRSRRSAIGGIRRLLAEPISKSQQSGDPPSSGGITPSFGGLRAYPNNRGQLTKLTILSKLTNVTVAAKRSRSKAEIRRLLAESGRLLAESRRRMAETMNYEL